MRRLLLLLSVFLSLAGGEAAAHARLASASPEKGATVKSGVIDLELTFNEAVEPALSVIAVSDGTGQPVLSSKGTPVCADRVCRLRLPPLSAGDFTVSYHVLSVDGHVVKGSYVFHVAD
jgi:methionine-rich copper-binding protein CopC